MMRLQHATFTVALIALVALIPLAAYAATFIADEGRRAAITEPIEDDLYIFANTIRINAAIARNLFAAGQTIEVNEEVGVNAYVAGNTIRINSSVGGDLFAAAQTVDITENASLEDDVYIAGQNVTIDGTIAGTVRARAASVTVASGAIIEGDLLVFGGEPVVEEGAAITGTVRHEEATRTPQKLAIANWVRQVVMLFVVALLLLYVIPPFTRSVLETVKAQPVRYMLVALLWLLLIIPITIILFVTVIGIPLAVAMLLMTVVFYILATGYAAILIGTWVMDRISPSSPAWPHALLGAVIYQGAQFLLGPVGWVLTFLVVLLGFGALAKTFRVYIQHGQHTSAD